MSIVQLAPSGTNPPNTYANTATYAVGNFFHVAQSGCQLTGIGWYRATTGSNAPTDLAVWDASNGALVAIIGPNDDGTVGWQWTNFPGSILQPYHSYCVGGRILNGFTGSYWTGSTAPDAPISYEATKYLASTAEPPPLPTTANADEYGFNVSVDTNPPAGGTGAATPADVQNQMADWLISTSDNTHKTDGLPWLSKVAIDALKTELDLVYNGVAAVKNVTGGSSGLLAFALNNMLDRYLNDITTIEGYINAVPGTLVGSGAGGGGSAFTALSDQLGHAITPVASLPGTGWAMTAETDFTDAIAYSVAADLYVVDVYTWDPALGSAIFDGVPVVFRLGWWSPLNGTYLQERRFFDFTTVHLVDGGRRMNGALIALPRTGTGHVQAWTYTP